MPFILLALKNAAAVTNKMFLFFCIGKCIVIENFQELS